MSYTEAAKVSSSKVQNRRPVVPTYDSTRVGGLDTNTVGCKLRAENMLG